MTDLQLINTSLSSSSSSSNTASSYKEKERETDEDSSSSSEELDEEFIRDCVRRCVDSKLLEFKTQITALQNSITTINRCLNIFQSPIQSPIQSGANINQNPTKNTAKKKKRKRIPSLADCLDKPHLGYAVFHKGMKDKNEAKNWISITLNDNRPSLLIQKSSKNIVWFKLNDSESIYFKIEIEMKNNKLTINYLDKNTKKHLKMDILHGNTKFIEALSIVRKGEKQKPFITQSLLSNIIIVLDFYDKYKGKNGSEQKDDTQITRRKNKRKLPQSDEIDKIQNRFKNEKWCYFGNETQKKLWINDQLNYLYINEIALNTINPNIKHKKKINYICNQNAVTLFNLFCQQRDFLSMILMYYKTHLFWAQDTLQIQITKLKIRRDKKTSINLNDLVSNLAKLFPGKSELLILKKGERERMIVLNNEGFAVGLHKSEISDYLKKNYNENKENTVIKQIEKLIIDSTTNRSLLQKCEKCNIEKLGKSSCIFCTNWRIIKEIEKPLNATERKKQRK